MDTKPPFEAEHNCICAYPGLPILEFYKGYFKCVYIILHPFYKIDKQDNSTQLVTWNEFISLADFKDINQLDIALRNLIGGLVAKWTNEADVDILKHTCEFHKLQMPSEGEFQNALKQNMLLSLQEQGHAYMFIADEHGFERKSIFIQSVIDNNDIVELSYPGHENWYTNKNEILYTTHWDSYFTLLCSDRATVESILSRHPFEGFYCDDTTEIYWCCKS